MIELQILYIFSFPILWFLEPFGRISMRRIRMIYKKTKTTVIPKPPSWTFGIIWPILYVIVAVSGILFFAFAPNRSGGVYIACFSLYFANYIVNKLWMGAFFDALRFWIAAFIALAISATAIAVEVLLFLNGINGYTIASGVLYAFYVIWTSYATLLSIDVAFSTNRREVVHHLQHAY